MDTVQKQIHLQISTVLGVTNPKSTSSIVHIVHERSTTNVTAASIGVLGVFPPTATTSTTPPLMKSIECGTSTSNQVMESSLASPASIAPALAAVQTVYPTTIPTTTFHQSQPPRTWAERIRAFTDMSLSRLVPALVSSTGKPKIKIPDEVFQRGADLHKEYIGGYFLGKLRSYHLIQSVLSHIWERGKKLEIHVNHGARTMLVRLCCRG